MSYKVYDVQCAKCGGIVKDCFLPRNGSMRPTDDEVASACQNKKEEGEGCGPFSPVIGIARSNSKHSSWSVE